MPDYQSPLAHEAIFTIRTYEIDSRKQATPVALVRLMQEAAMQNVLRLGLSVWDLEPHGISWVLMRLTLRIERLPGLGEQIRVSTCPTGFEKVFTHRDYRVFDAAGMLIATSSSTWLPMDTQTRRMTRIPDFIMKYQQQVPPPDQWLPRAPEKLPAPEAPDRSKNRTVEWYDLDFNMHLNNTLYIQWLLETLDDNILQHGNLRALDILFRAEGRRADTLRTEHQRVAPDTFVHSLTNATTQKELAAMRTVWLVAET